MPEYTSVSLDEGVRETLQQFKDGDETYSDVIRRAMGHEAEYREKEKARWKFVNERLNEQSRLLVRMAVEMGLDKEQIPENMAEYEAQGGNSPWAPGGEQTVDVFSDEKQAEFEQYDQERITVDDLKEFEVESRSRHARDDNNGGDN
jgi:predicted CopG family antitoxin